MARVLAVVPDLLFGSKVQAALQGAGHEVELAVSEPDAWDKVAGTDVLVVDLGAEEVDGVVLAESLRAGGELPGVRVLGFYPHVEVELRRRAEQAGFDLVVPRSRMAREAGALVAGLAGGSAGGS